MPTITYQNEARIEVDSATPILLASLQNGIPHTHVCGGNPRCSTCNLSANVRLACQTTVTGDVVLRRLVLDDDDRALVDAEVIGAAPRSVGEERLLAILFSDIRNFTAFSEAHPADQDRFISIGQRDHVTDVDVTGQDHILHR